MIHIQILFKSVCTTFACEIEDLKPGRLHTDERDNLHWSQVMILQVDGTGY